MTVLGAEVSSVASGSRVPLLQARGISKNFPGVKALQDVNFSLYGGQVHALVGENGAGKSTLMKIFAGLYQPDGGELYSHGNQIVLPTPVSAHENRISVIHQEFFLMNHLTVAQNIFIGREPKLPGGFLNDDRALNAKAQELVERLGVDIDPRARVANLSVAAQQMVEIAKAISFDSEVLIMDEPTAALTDAEVQTLFRIIHDFVTPNTGVVYISHRMDEIQEISTQITVLRDGQYVDSRPTVELKTPDVIQLMVGREIATDVRPEPRSQESETVLEVENLSTSALLKNVSFSLQRGEILGFAGLMGAGRTETARALVGADQKSGGKVTIFGKQAHIANPHDAVELGIGYLSEDRKRFGLILMQTIVANVVLPSLAMFERFGLIQDGKARVAAEKYRGSLAIKTPSVMQQVRNLSGGNQQKVVLAKWLERDCDILIFDEPTRGIDVGAKQEIYDLLHQLVAQGKSIIMISSEMEEVLRMANRIAVMCDGRITGFLNNEEATGEKIMELATQFNKNTQSEGVNA